MEFSYYPGCSLHSTACEYNDSVEQVFIALQVGLHELEDWNCCGATSAHSFNRELAMALPARNLALAQSAGRDVVMPCAACYNRHRSVDFELKHNPERRAYLEHLVSFEYTGQVAIRPLLDVVANEVGFDQVQAQVRQPLQGLKAVGYYGCLLVRPPEVTQFDDPNNPVLMNQLLDTLGAEPVPWSYATECCGGGLSLTKAKVAAKLVDRLVAHAREAGAEAIVTSCPLCQANLEMRQSASPMPIFYFTELMGLAFNLDKTHSWWNKHLINPVELLKRLSLS